MAKYESLAPVIDFEALLQPISEENPVGESLQYSGVYDEIREARRADDPGLSQGQWQTELKVADYRQVVNLATSALTSQTKDLQICVWFCEALTYQHGFAGLRDGLQLIRRMEENFWDTLFPEIDEGDMEARANATEWLDTQLSLAVLKVPITAGTKLNYIQWNESTQYDFPDDIESLPYEEKNKVLALKTQAEQEKRITGEIWRAAKAASNRAFCEVLNLTIDECKAELAALDRTNEEKFDRNQMPAVRLLKKALEDISAQVIRVVEEKRELEPDEIEEIVEEVVNEDGETVVVTKGPAVATGAIQNRQDALKRLAEISDYFRKNEPHSPISYLVQRAVKWGNMPLEVLLQDIIKDEGIIYQIRQMLGFNTGSEGGDS